MTTEVVPIEKRVPAQVAEANALVISTQEQYAGAGEFLKGVKALQKEIEDHHGPMKKKARAAWQEIVDREKDLLNPLLTAEETIKNKMGAFLDAEDARKREEARKAEEKERKKRAEELERINKKLDGLLVNATGLEEQIAALDRELENPEISEAERELYVARKSSLLVRKEQADGAVESAFSALEEKAAAPITSAVATPAAPKVAGISTKIEKIPEVVEPMKLVKAIAAGTAPIGLIKEWNQATLKKLVNAGMTFPGVHVTEKRGISSRRAS